MLRIIKTEFLKYKRYNILWIGIVSVFFSIVLAAFQLAGTNNSIITAISKNTSVEDCRRESYGITLACFFLSHSHW